MSRSATRPRQASAGRQGAGGPRQPVWVPVSRAAPAASRASSPGRNWGQSGRHSRTGSRGAS
eukprot:15477000-Alexandrium_andersonii.AAC.1